MNLQAEFLKSTIRVFSYLDLDISYDLITNCLLLMSKYLGRLGL